jgi:predicted amidohydrolase YtcJ
LFRIWGLAGAFALAFGFINDVEAGSVFYGNAVIWTGDPARPWAEAMLVKDSRIVAVGSEAEVEAEAGSGVKRVDLGGSFVCPGLIDAHAHVLGFGLSLERVNLVGTQSLEETLDRIRDYVVQRREEGFTGWIRGRGWDQNDWPVTEFPTRRDLDLVSEDFPVVLSRIGGHAMWANSRALTLAGIDSETPDPAGGKIHRDASGKPTGILVDTAKEFLVSAIPETDREVKSRAIRRAIRAMAEAGLTGAHDMGMSTSELTIYRELEQKGELDARIYASISSTDPELQEVLDRGPDREWQGGTFKLGMVKFFVDGAMGSRGAALIGDYSDDPGNRGLLIIETDSLAAGMKDALNAGFQCAVHAIGDRGNRTVLDCWESILVKNPEVGTGHSVPGAALSLIGEVEPIIPPVRIEHAQVIHPDDLGRVGELGGGVRLAHVDCRRRRPGFRKRFPGGIT